LLKLPSLKTTSAFAGSGQESIAIEINPVNPTTGSTTKKRGISNKRSSSELEEISRIITNPKLAELAKKIYEVNLPEIKTKARSTADSDIIEI
jgi:hypothetical protein